MKKYNTVMILHDWLAGKPIESIRKTYGFKSVRYLRRKISQWREDGWPFERRKPGRPRRPRGIKIVDVWCEEVTAGSILQSVEEVRHGKVSVDKPIEVRCPACGCPVVEHRLFEDDALAGEHIDCACGYKSQFGKEG